MNKSRLLMLILVSMIGCHVYSSDALAQSVGFPSRPSMGNAIQFDSSKATV